MKMKFVFIALVMSLMVVMSGCEELTEALAEVLDLVTAEEIAEQLGGTYDTITYSQEKVAYDLTDQKLNISSSPAELQTIYEGNLTTFTIKDGLVFYKDSPFETELYLGMTDIKNRKVYMFEIFVSMPDKDVTRDLMVEKAEVTLTMNGKTGPGTLLATGYVGDDGKITQKQLHFLQR